MILITPESTPDLLATDIAILPYARADRIASPFAERDLLFSFVGTQDYPFPWPSIRSYTMQAHWRELQRRAEALRTPFFVGSLAQARARFGRATTYTSLYARSHFVLCPAGWARYSFRLLEAIHAGAIPVLLSDYYRLPFGEWVRWERFALVQSERSLAGVPARLARVQGDSLHSLKAALIDAQIQLAPEAQLHMFLDELQERLPSMNSSPRLVQSAGGR